MITRAMAAGIVLTLGVSLAQAQDIPLGAVYPLTGGVSYDAKNHDRMVRLRSEKVARVAQGFEDPAYHQSWLDAQHTQFNPPTS